MLGPTCIFWANITPSPPKDPHYLASAMKFVKVETEQAYYTNRNAWNAMAFEKEVAFWEVAIFKHAKQYFPHVRGSDWTYKKWTSDYWYAPPRIVLADHRSVRSVLPLTPRARLESGAASRIRRPTCTAAPPATRARSPAATRMASRPR